MTSLPAGAGRRPQRPLPSQRSDADSLGRGQGRDFQFTSPDRQEAWLREAYRQGVNADTWHLGDKVDDRVRDAILAGVGGAQPPMYRGPDRQYYFQNARTMEGAITRGYRAQHFAGKTMDQIAAAKMPGEDEYVTLRQAQSARAVAAAKHSIKPANDDVHSDYSSPEAAVQAQFGMMPDIPRTTILPDARGPDGEFTSDVSHWTAPQFVYDLAKAFVTPSVAAHGGKVSDADALNLALTITGGGVVGKAAPRVGPVTSETGETLASRHAKLYNGPQVQRPFSKDYPDGHQADTAGNLIHDIDGNPLEIGGRIVGRKVAGGTDEALPAEEFDAIAEAATGRDPARSALAGNDLGRVAVNPYTGLPKEVILSNKLTPKELPGVYGHEIGHVIDQLAGEIPVAGLSKELKVLYDTGNNPNRSQTNPDLAAAWGKPFTPEALGYKGDDIPREWMAEAIRLYMANPSYVKEVAPKTAAAIRKAVNRNPLTARIIQFNTGGAPSPALPMSDEEWEAWTARGGI